MKKFLSAIVLTLCSVLLVGCGGTKNLKCSTDYSSQMGMTAYGIKAIADVDVNFKSDKIQDVKMSFTFTLPDNLKSNIDTFVSTLESTIKAQYSGEHFTVTATKISDTDFSISVAMDYKNMTEAEKIAANMNSGSEKYSVNKSQFEKQGFTCK